MPEKQADLVEVDAISAARFHDEFEAMGRPVVFRRLVRHWPVVQAGLRSAEALSDYLRRFDRGRPVGAMLGPPRINGRFSYSDDLGGFNFKRQTVKVSGAMDFLLSVAEDERPPAFAIQSAQVWQNLPGFESDNPMPLLDPEVEPRVWIGNRVTVAAHHDPSENIACVVAGRRRFTLFPPDQIGNLYIGPFERTPAGTTISLVDFDAPDLERFPRFAEAMAAAVEIDLEPGDALYIPYMWWHHVRSLEPVNMLVNYWWKPPAPTKDHPMDALLHAILTVRDLPEAHRRAWKAHFDHYVFEANGPAAAHLPDDRKGVLGDLDAEKVKSLREALQKGLDRS
jgi:hypothetical protein